jgi:hypothetical protein
MWRYVWIYIFIYMYIYIETLGRIGVHIMIMMMFTFKESHKGVTKSNPTQKCRPAKGTSKRVNIKIIQGTGTVETIGRIGVYIHLYKYL